MQAAVQLGWIILAQHADPNFAGLVDDSELDEAEQHFAAALAADPQDLEVSSGLGLGFVAPTPARIGWCGLGPGTAQDFEVSPR